MTNCYYDEIAEEIPTDTLVSFQLDIQPILASNCTACHPLIVSSPDLTESNSYSSNINDSYVLPINPDSSFLYQRLLANPYIMPTSGPLSSSDIGLVKKWVDQDALKN